MAKPDFKIMVAQKTEQKTFYKQVGVAWKGTTKDGREKVELQLWLFPNLTLTCFLDDGDEGHQRRQQTQPPDEGTPF